MFISEMLKWFIKTLYEEYMHNVIYQERAMLSLNKNSMCVF